MMESQNENAPAGFWIRFVAALLDGILVGGVTFALFMVGAPAILGFIIGLGYWIYFPSSDMMATPGKSVLGLKITDNDGNQISAGTAFVRYIGYIISAIVLYIGFIMVGFSDKKRGLHDIIAGTLVVYK